jgi:pilus assembly protein CpaF
VFSIVITERGGAQRQLDFGGSEVSIGRIEGNDVILPKNNVSKRHARMVFKDDRYIVIDLKSTNGTYVNGRRISAPMVVAPGDKIYIGDFILSLRAAARAGLSAPPSPRPHPADARPSAAPPRPHAPEPMDEPGLGAPGVPHNRPSGPPPPLSGAPASAPPTERPPAPETPPPPPTVSGRPPRPSPDPLRGDDDDAPAERAAPQPTPSEPPQEAHLQQEPESGDEVEPAQTGERRALPTDRPPHPEPGLDAEEPPTEGEQRPTASRLRRVDGPAPMRVSSMPPRLEDPESGAGPATSPAVLAPSVRLQGALHTLMERLGARMDVTRTTEHAFPSEHQRTLESLIDGLADDGIIGPELDRRFLTEAAISEAVGLGPLDRLLNNRSVREVVVDGPSRILADLGGGLSPVSSFFSSSGAVRVVAARLLARAGKALNDAAVQEAQLPGGGHAQVLLPPLSPGGPLISVRCAPQLPISASGLVTEGVLSTEMLNLLRAAMKHRINVLVVGRDGAGVSTVLSALASLSQDHERIVALQRVPSLSIDHPHVLPLQALPQPGASLPELLDRAARLRADRLVIDDLPVQDGLPVLTHAALGHGVLVGMHAADPPLSLELLELFAQARLGGSSESLASLLGHAFGLVVHMRMDADGARRMVSLGELQHTEGDRLGLRTLYRYDHGFKATEHRARFLEQ